MQNNAVLPKELYHYTSWETFEKIVKNHTWRFSSINITNDISENLNLYLKQLLEDKNLISNITQNVKTDIIHYIDTNNYYGIKKYFIACFSKKKDDLGQWRVSYGNYGQGVCIGINPKYFTKQQFSKSKDCLGWSEVIYEISEQKKLLKTITEKFEKYNEDDYIEDNSLDLSWELRDIAMLMKHKAFCIENEYRLIVPMIDNEILDENFCSLEEDYQKTENERVYFIKNINPNIQEDDLVKCIDYDLNSSAREGEGDLFTSILLGKDCKKKKDDVTKLLKENGFDVSNISITKSDIPYRFSDDRCIFRR